MSGSPSSIPNSTVRSLSPSDESRFVPYSSIMGSSSVLERHFAASSNITEPEQPRAKANDPIEMPSALDDEKSVGLVGATICFTPESSPVSSPNRKAFATAGGRVNASTATSVHSQTSGSNNYIGSLHEDDPMDNTGMESVVSIMKSSAVRVASSLDGRSITEYEVLDGIHSRGTIECDDLISEDGSGEHPFARSGTNSSVKGNDHRVQNLSGSIICPSLNCVGYDDLTLPTLASPFREFKSTPSDEARVVSGGEEGHSSSLMNSNAGILTEDRGAVVENERTDGGSVNSSPVDDRPLNAFMTLQKFWEGHSTVSSMTKSMMWRVLGTEAPTDITPTSDDVPNDDKAGIDTEATPAKSSEGIANSTMTIPIESSDSKWSNLLSRFTEEAAREKQPTENEAITSSEDISENVQSDSVNEPVGIIAKCKHVISTVINTIASLCFLFMFVYICNFLPTPGNNVTQEEFENLSQHEHDIIAIPTEEPPLEEDDVLDDHTSTFEGTWLGISTVLALMLGAIIFRPKNRVLSPTEPMPAACPNHVVGIWSEEEHRQFLEGYNKHGSKWKMVSTFVPTRSDTQVRAHGTYWLKVRSPPKMTRARVVTAPTPTNSPDNPMKNENSPSSLSSGKSTPTKSNLSSDAKTPIASNKDKAPIKGILTVKDRNRSSKHVTPKTEHKPRKSVLKQGPKSEPIKRVRIQAV